MKSVKYSLVQWTTVVFICVAASSAQAVIIGNTQGSADFPQGAISFADAVIDYSPGIVSPTQPSEPHRGAFNALGLPDYTGDNSCSSQADCTFVSLGDGGSITLRFIDNKLTGSGSSALDLYIFEVGPDVEDMFVEISKDGMSWSAIGKVGGSFAGIDIDSFGFGIADIFEYVRLTDDGALDGQTGSTVGPDIDAVGAITSIATPPTNVPEPPSLLLVALGIGVLSLITRRRRYP